MIYFVDAVIMLYEFLNGLTIYVLFYQRYLFPFFRDTFTNIFVFCQRSYLEREGNIPRHRYNELPKTHVLDMFNMCVYSKFY